MNLRSIFGGFLLSTCVILVSHRGWFEPLNGRIFDGLVRQFSPVDRVQDEVITVGAQSETQLTEVARRVATSQPRLIVVLAETEGKLIGRFWPEKMGMQRWIPTNPPSDGIWRGMARKGEDSQPGLGAMVAAELGLPPLPETYLLDFRTPRDHLQVIEAGRVISGQVPRSLIEGKVVLVGVTGRAAPGFTTPAHRGEDALSPLLREAVMTDAVLRGGIVRVVPPSAGWLVSLMLSGLLAWVILSRKKWSISMVTVVFAVSLLLAVWVSLMVFKQWFPPVESLALLGVVGGTAVVTRSAKARSSLRQTLMNLTEETQKRAEKEGFLAGASPWSWIEGALEGAFPCQPNFTLRVVGGTSSLEPGTSRGQKSAGGRFSAVGLHTDRTPFSEAQEEGHAKFMGVSIVPLRTPNKLYGFWVVGADEIDAQAKDYADRSARMIERWEKWQGKSSSKSRTGQPLHDQLSAAIGLLDGGRRLLAEALDQARDTILVFDGSGHLLHASTPSIKLLDAAGIDPTNLRAASLLEELTEVEPLEIRQAIRCATTRGTDIDLMVSRHHFPGREFVLRLRPMGDEDDGLPGLVLLLEDVTQLGRASLLKDDFMERVFFQLNNDFEPILGAAALLGDARIGNEERQEVYVMLVEKTKEASGLIKEARVHLQTEFSPAPVERYPIQFGAVFEAAVGKMRKEAEALHIKIDTKVSDYLQLVLAAPVPLEELLQAVLSTLIHDAREDSRIEINALQEKRQLTVRFSNQGFGMPQEQLERRLTQATGNGQDTLGGISRGLATVAGWGGQLSVRSAVGRGMEVGLRLVSAI